MKREYLLECNECGEQFEIENDYGFEGVGWKCPCCGSEDVEDITKY